MNTDLLVTTYHWVKRLDLGEFNQGSWRCPYGLCFAGWMVVLSGEAEWLTDADAPHAHRLLATSADHPTSRLVHGSVQTTSVMARALRLAAPRDVNLFTTLVHHQQDLAGIRELLTQLLGADPEQLPPDEFVLSTYAKDDWRQAFDPSLARQVLASWAGESCGCTACLTADSRQEP